MSEIQKLRLQYHARICNEVIRIRQNSQKGNYPNFADGDSRPSKELAWGIFQQISGTENFEPLQPQTVGSKFERITQDFIGKVFDRLSHIRPGNWQYETGSKISNFAQYEHLDEITQVLDENPLLKPTFGGNYIVKPDIVVSRRPLSDDEINESDILLLENSPTAQYTYLRGENFSKPKSILHAVISCKWTIRTDRAQNTRTEVLNLIRNRKGHLPHVVAVTAEPWPARIAALALGTGDLDCVYHFALPELVKAAADLKNEDSNEMLSMMVEGRRLRDISDLPFDIAV